MSTQEIKVPDLGGADGVEVIEIQVKPGDQVAEEDTLMTLESEKAAMDIPSPMAGVVKAIEVKEGDKVSKGDVIVLMDTASDSKTEKVDQSSVEQAHSEERHEKTHEKQAISGATKLVEIKVPDLGGAESVEVIEIQARIGDKVDVESPLLTLESEKAAMDVPSPIKGIIKEFTIKNGDKVSEGDVLALVEVAEGSAEPAPVEKAVEQEAVQEEKSGPKRSIAPPKKSNNEIYAGPAVRRLAHELDIDLAQVNGSGEKSRITKEDIKRHLSGGGASSSGAAIAQAPVVDFSKFGEVENQPLSRINKLTAKNMTRNWLLVPHVTQFDDADITEMDAFRKANKAQAEKEGFKLTPLVFIMKAVVGALKAFPRVNASLDSTGENLVMKKYFHVGVAVDTPNGLVVPVIRDVDQKSLFELAKELGEISKKARDGKLMPKDMQGGCFTISSLGGIGGTAFTPIVNVPEVAILGVSKASMKPVYNGKEFEPRLILPLSLSYDHRVIDGAVGARFVTFVSQCLTDIRKLLL